MELVLASQSPRRKELLTLLGHPFRVQVASVDETMEDLPIEQAIARLSYRKAAAIGADADQIVIGADTVVVLNGQALGKPADAADAAAMVIPARKSRHNIKNRMTMNMVFPLPIFRKTWYTTINLFTQEVPLCRRIPSSSLTATA